MVEKRRDYIKHPVLIFLVVVVVFPVMWVVSTSFRRDEAAFSTKLFSSRLTVQHYRDLVSPERNIPVLIQNLQNMLSRVKPYSDWTYERLKKAKDDELKRLKDYLSETKRRYDSAKASYQNVVNKMSERAETVKTQVVNLAKALEEKVSVPSLSFSPELGAALYEVLRERGYSSDAHLALKTDLEKFTGIDTSSPEGFQTAVEQLRIFYEQLGGKYRGELSALEEKMKNIQKELESVKRRQELVQGEVLEMNLIFERDLFPEFTSISETLTGLVSLKRNLEQTKMATIFFVDDEIFLRTVPSLLERSKEVLEKLEVFSDHRDLAERLKSVVASLGELSEIDEVVRSKTAYADLVKAYENLYPRLERSLTELSNNLEVFESKFSLLKELNGEIEKLQRELQALSRDKEALKKKVEALEKSLEEPRRTLSLKVFTHQLRERIDSLETIKGLRTPDLLKYSAFIEFLRNFANSYRPRGEEDEVLKVVRETLEKMRWIEEYRTFVSKFENFSRNLGDVLGKFEQQLKDFENVSDQLLRVASSGVFVTSEILNNAYDLVKMDFVSRVRAEMSVAARKAGTLMDVLPFSDLRRDLRNVDSQLFRIDQIWKQKTKHYFWRWVLNSVVVSLVVAFITTAVCAVAAYPFSRMRFFGRRYGIMALLLIQMFPGVIFMIAIYDLLNFLGKYIPFMGVDSLGGLIFAYLTGIAYNMYLIKGFYDTIPDSLEEAAIVDGATRFQSFYKIVLPLARPILTVVFLLVFIGTFNEYVVARIVLQRIENYTYALGLNAFATGPYETEWGLFTAAALLGMMPMVILFLSLQRYLVSGLTRGAVKG